MNQNHDKEMEDCHHDYGKFEGFGDENDAAGDKNIVNHRKVGSEEQLDSQKKRGQRVWY